MLRDVIKSFYYEFLSYFVPVRQKYKITGKCNKCGNCCRQIRAKGMKSEKDLKLMQIILPWYKRFFIKGEDKNGELILSCKYLNSNGSCKRYFFRPFVCRNYPKKSVGFNGEMPDGCGYTIEKKSFEDYLK